MFGITSSTVNKILNSLMYEGIVIRRKVFTKGSYYYEYKIIDDIKMIIVRTENQANEIKKLLKDNNSIHIFTHDEIKQNIIGIGHQIEKK